MNRFDGIKEYIIRNKIAKLEEIIECCEYEIESIEKNLTGKNYPSLIRIFCVLWARGVPKYMKIVNGLLIKSKEITLFSKTTP